MKHSPLPWQAEQEDITCPSEQYDLLMSAFSPLDQSVDCDDNVKFAVHACNNFYALREALEEIVKEYESHEDNAYCELGIENIVLQQARAALAQSEIK